MTDNCIFCRIIRDELPSYRVYEDENTLAFLDINPAAPGHTLIIPKTHVAQVEDMTGEDTEALFRTLHKLVDPIQRAFNTPASTILVNNGKNANQVVPHVHIHVIPRKHMDRLSNVHNFVRTQKKVGPQELGKNAEKIREHI